MGFQAGRDEVRVEARPPHGQALLANSLIHKEIKKIPLGEPVCVRDQRGSCAKPRGRRARFSRTWRCLPIEKSLRKPIFTRGKRFGPHFYSFVRRRRLSVSARGSFSHFRGSKKPTRLAGDVVTRIKTIRRTRGASLLFFRARSETIAICRRRARATASCSSPRRATASASAKCGSARPNDVDSDADDDDDDAPP